MSARPSATRLGDVAAPRRQGRVLGGAVSLALHLLVLAGLFWVRPGALREPEPEPVSASLVSLPRPEPAPPEPSKPSPAKAGGDHSAVRPAAPLVQPALVAADKPKPDTSDLLSDSQIAGAASVGEEGGGGGGVCDLTRAVQRALRRDPLVQTAVLDAHRAGKAMLVWNGDWVRSGDQDGKGLAAVREAIMWEVAFAPEACRTARMHGLVLFTLGDGATRLALGSGDWRWSDLLAVRGVGQDR